MTIRETLPNRKVKVVVNYVDDSGHQFGTTETYDDSRNCDVIDSKYLAVIPLQKKYIFFVPISGLKISSDTV